MKKFVVSLTLFFVLAALVVFHSAVLFGFGKKVENLSKNIISAAQKDDWQKTLYLLEENENEWNKKRLWAAVTIKTNVIEDIDISLNQSKAMAKLKAKPDFFSEFLMLEKLLQHIPHQEGLHIEEIL